MPIGFLVTRLRALARVSRSPLMARLPELDPDELVGRTVVCRKAANRFRRTGLLDLTVFLERPEALSAPVGRSQRHRS